MPRRLLREPHLLAHELRTPLSVMSRWYSLIRDGDITPESPHRACAMQACEDAVDRLNFVIAEACNEAEAMTQLQPDHMHRMLELMEMTTRAIDESERVRELIARRQLPAMEPHPRTMRSLAARATTASGGLRKSGFASKTNP